MATKLLMKRFAIKDVSYILKCRERVFYEILLKTKDYTVL